MKFLIDRCAGQLLADWLRKQGHDVVESRELGPDPGDRTLIAWAAEEARILITIDTDFGELIYVENLSHNGLVRLPDVPARERMLIMEDLLTRYETELQNAAIITVRSGRIRMVLNSSVSILGRLTFLASKNKFNPFYSKADPNLSGLAHSTVRPH